MLRGTHKYDGVLKRYLKIKPILLTLAAVGIALFAFGMWANDDKLAAPVATPSSALTVLTTQAQSTHLPLTISANGNVAAWQEASIGAEANGLRLVEVRVNVGDVVERGQVLAVFSADTVQADVAQVQAAVAEAEAMLAEAAANAQRARNLQPTGVMSAQQTNQYLTAERTAQARLEAQRATLGVRQLRLQQTQVVAPDHGVISARSAAVGAVPQSGQELFRLIRQARLEWRAEVSSTDLAALQPGMRATIISASGLSIQGRVRKIAPTVDVQTRNGLVYVDLPSPGSVKAGMFARGEFKIGSGQGLTLPQSAVLLRDGFSYVMRVGADSKVAETKITVGQRIGDRIEITGGLDAAAHVVASGGAFLSDGDTVRVAAAAAEKHALQPSVKSAATTKK